MSEQQTEQQRLDDFYPELSEAGQEKAMELIAEFKKKLAKEADSVILDLYTDVMHHIEGDSWTNFRQHIVNGLCNYSNAKSSHYDFKMIRQSILKNHRDEIIKDLNQDLLVEIQELKHHIELIERSRY